MGSISALSCAPWGNTLTAGLPRVYSGIVACSGYFILHIFACTYTRSLLHLSLIITLTNNIMCGDTYRPTFGGTIAVLFPRENNLSSERSLSSSPDSVTSQSTSSSTASMSSYSLFFRETNNHKTKAIFRIDDPETYQALSNFGNVDMRIE